MITENKELPELIKKVSAGDYIQIKNRSINDVLPQGYYDALVVQDDDNSFAVDTGTDLWFFDRECGESYIGNASVIGVCKGHGVRVKDLNDLQKCIGLGQSVHCPKSSGFSKPTSAAFMLNQQGRVLSTLFDLGMYVHKKSKGQSLITKEQALDWLDAQKQTIEIKYDNCEGWIVEDICGGRFVGSSLFQAVSNAIGAVA